VLFVDYETKAGLPHGTFRQAIQGQAYTAWAKLEKGEISLEEFSRKFSDECSEIVSNEFLLILSYFCYTISINKAISK